jgi:hypothetical protein
MWRFIREAIPEQSGSSIDLTSPCVDRRLADNKPHVHRLLSRHGFRLYLSNFSRLLESRSSCPAENHTSALEANSGNRRRVAARWHNTTQTMIEPDNGRRMMYCFSTLAMIHKDIVGSGVRSGGNGTTQRHTHWRRRFTHLTQKKW